MGKVNKGFEKIKVINKRAAEIRKEAGKRTVTKQVCRITAAESVKQASKELKLGKSKSTSKRRKNAPNKSKKSGKQLKMF